MSRGVALAGAALLGGIGARVLAPRFVQSIGRLSRNVADLARAEAFYCGRLGFRVISRWSRADPAFGELLGRPGLRARAALLVLGGQRVQLLQCDPPGAPYPTIGADDPAFQHAAIVVGDIDRAWAVVGDAAPISTGGPQILAGELRAIKFRDPDGHPLELLQFGPGQGRACWRATENLFRGIDHSAIGARDLGASLRFYRDLLGLRVTTRSLNQGPSQAALDGLPPPVLRVTQLAPHDADSPRIELLNYLSVRPPQVLSGRSNDIGKDRLVLHVTRIDELFRRLIRNGARFVSPGLVAIDDQRGMLVRDPDGHDLLLMAR